MAHIRARETAFYETSLRGIDDAIGKDGRLFDGMRAATLLSSWLYGMGRYAEVGQVSPSGCMLKEAGLGYGWESQIVSAYHLGS